jgi:hypothetical protein
MDEYIYFEFDNSKYYYAFCNDLLLYLMGHVYSKTFNVINNWYYDNETNAYLYLYYYESSELIFDTFNKESLDPIINIFMKFLMCNNEKKLYIDNDLYINQKNIILTHESYDFSYNLLLNTSPSSINLKDKNIKHITHLFCNTYNIICNKIYSYFNLNKLDESTSDKVKLILDDLQYFNGKESEFYETIICFINSK